MSIRVARKRADTYQHGDLRRALVQAGLKLLSEQGVGALSLRAAAELAGVSHAAPYRHFRDKNALLSAIAEESFRLLTTAMRDEIGACAAGDIPARLRAAGQGYVAFAVKHPAYFRTIFGGVSWPKEGDDDPSGIALRAAGQESLGVLLGLIEEGLKAGVLRGGNPQQIAIASWSVVHGLAMLIIDRQLLAGLAESPAAVRALVDKAVDALHHGQLA